MGEYTCLYCGDDSRTKQYRHFCGRKLREGCCPDFLVETYGVQRDEIVALSPDDGQRTWQVPLLPTRREPSRETQAVGSLYWPGLW